VAKGSERIVAPTPGERTKTPWQDAGGGPGRPPLVKRDSLLAALDRAAAGKVSIIAAPAGSGKTSLLRTWAERQDPDGRLAMVQVQRDQHDAQLFWLALYRAVRALSGAPTSTDPAVATLDFSGAAMVDRILAELADHGDDVVIAIDDVHELASQNTLAHLTYLLTNLPLGTHAILATRRDLPLRLHQLRLAGELAELRATDLRFTEQETRELLAASGITLSATGVSLLHQRAEGWAAGLRLAAISLAGHPDPERFVAEFSGNNRTVAEYLVSEMLERQPADVQHLLLRTSILDRVNGELADLLTGRPGAERILLDLEDANAFVVSLDPERTWFRYHHLFADLLRLELRRRLAGEVTALHRQAADWYTRQGRIVEAVRHRQAEGDWSEAAALLADHSFGMMLDGQEETMAVLLRAFPRRAGTNHPELSVVRAMVDLVHGRLDDAAAHLAVAEACLESASPDRRGRLGASLSSLELSLARRRGSLTDVLHHAKFLTSPTSGRSGEEIALGSDLRVMALMNLGTVEAWSLGLSDGERHLREGSELARKIGRPYLEVACLAQLGFATKLPSFTYSRRHCEEAIALAEEHGWADADHPRARPGHARLHDGVDGRVRQRRPHAAARRRGPEVGQWAGHQNAAAPGEGDGRRGPWSAA
jgi:LuxR family maltose regulon positive regulatory protein